MDISITFLADFLGVARENASRACKKLVDMNLITVDRKRIYVHDTEQTVLFFKCG